jgi:hypothetical protein
MNFNDGSGVTETDTQPIFFSCPKWPKHGFKPVWRYTAPAVTNRRRDRICVVLEDRQRRLHLPR